MTRRWTEEEIAALIDGALDGARAEQLKAILEDDPEAAALAREIEASNTLLRDAFDGIETAPVPATLEAAVLGEPGKVVSFKADRWAPAHWLSHAVAASVFLAIGIVGGAYFDDGASEGPVIGPGPLSADSPLLAALETLPSGQSVRDTYVPMLTFQDAAGRYCREFEIRGALPDQLAFGIACRQAKAPDWQVEIVVTAPVVAPGSAGYALASGPAADALEAMLDSLGAGQILAPADEAAAISTGWNIR